MLKFNKDFNAKIVSVVIVVLFLFNSSAYGIDLSRNIPPDKLRVPVGVPDVYNRITKAIETWEENEKDIDSNIKSAHKEKRANLLHQTEKGAKAIEVAHSFLEANNFTKEEIDLFVKLQEKAAIEVPDWGLDKGGLWLVAPKPEEALPNEHASDRGGIHIVAYPDVDIACAYVHGMAAYVGFSHEQAEALEKAFAEWRNEKKPIPEKLKAEFHEGIGKRKDNPFLLTELSKQEKGEGKSQRDYTSFLSNQKKDPHGTYKRLLKTILGEAEAVYMQFLVDNSVPDAKDMARNFAEDALASIIRRETESNFVIPYLPEDFPTLLQLIDNIAEESSLEQEMALNQYVRQIIGALLFLEIPTYLRNQWSQSAAASQKFPLLGDGATAMLNLQGLTKEQHDLLNQALGVFFTGLNQVREDVHPLTDAELNNIDPNSDLRNIPNLRAYRFTKEQLRQALEKIEASEEEIDYIIKNLISHPGRFRDGQGNPRATNLFILDEHYILLSQLSDELKAQWARHERAHLENITRSEEDVQQEHSLGEVAEELKKSAPSKYIGELSVAEQTAPRLEWLIDKVFEKEGYADINTLREFLQEVALDIGLNPNETRPILTGSSVYLANESGYVDLNTIGDIDIFWEIPQNLENKKFEQIREEFSKKLYSLLKRKQRNVELTRLSQGAIDIYTLEFILQSGSGIKMSIANIAGPDIVEMTLQQMRDIFNMSLEEMQLEMKRGDYTKGIKRCFMLLFYLGANPEIKDKFKIFKDRYFAIFIMNNRRPGQAIRTLLIDMFGYIQTIKETNPKIIEDDINGLKRYISKFFLIESFHMNSKNTATSI